MSNIYIQFEDATESAVISYFGAPQNPTAYANQGTMTTNDSRWSAYFNALPVAIQNQLPAPTTS
jgi:hypothetical protein